MHNEFFVIHSTCFQRMIKTNIFYGIILSPDEGTIYTWLI